MKSVPRETLQTADLVRLGVGLASVAAHTRTGQFCTRGSWRTDSSSRQTCTSWRAVSGVLPAEFAEPVVVDAEVVGDLVDDGAADLVGDLLLAAAGCADRLAVDGDAVGQNPRVLRRATGERDALVKPEQRRPWRCSTVTATLRISWPSSSGSPSSAATTISSKRPGSTSIISPLSNAALPTSQPWRGATAEAEDSPGTPGS